MDVLYRTLLIVHVAAGFTSLAVFCVPRFARKGGRAHVRAGWVYVYGMTGVLVTSLLMSLIMFWVGNYTYGLFFSFLSLITSRPLYWGTLIVRYRQTGAPRTVQRVSFVLLTGIALLSPVLLVWGTGWFGSGGNPLLIVFGLLGLTNWPEWLRMIRRGEITRQGPYPDWLIKHIEGLLTSSIAAFTAFFAFGGSRLFNELLTGNWMLIPWVLPTLLGTLTIRYYKRRYRTVA